MPPFGQFFQIFNAKWFYILGCFVFEVGSALCGAAPSMNALIIGRVIAGIWGYGNLYRLPISHLSQYF